MIKWISYTSNISFFALCPLGSMRKSSVKRRHSLTLSGETKSRAIFVQDCKSLPEGCNQLLWTEYSYKINTIIHSGEFLMQK